MIKTEVLFIEALPSTCFTAHGGLVGVVPRRIFTDPSLSLYVREFTEGRARTFMLLVSLPGDLYALASECSLLFLQNTDEQQSRRPTPPPSRRSTARV